MYKHAIRILWMGILPILQLACGDKSQNPKPIHTKSPAAKLVISAGLSPDPSTLELTATGWSNTPFTVALNHPIFDYVKIIANPGDTEPLIELSPIHPSEHAHSSFCPPEVNDIQYQRINSELFIEVCGSGTANLEIQTLQGIPIDTLSFNVGDHSQSSSFTLPPAPPRSAFNIDLVFVDKGQLSEQQRFQVKRAARKWEQAITGDLPNYTYYARRPRSQWHESIETTITLNKEIDDLVIYVGVGSSQTNNTFWAWGQPWITRHRSQTGLTIAGIIGYNPNFLDQLGDSNNFYNSTLHEMAHILGFNEVMWAPDRFNLIRSPYNNPYFIGSRAIRAFNEAGGFTYRGRKVPLQQRSASHWRTSVFGNEIMVNITNRDNRLSKITIAAMADIGYRVNYNAADEYRLPHRAAKPAPNQQTHHHEGHIRPTRDSTVRLTTNNHWRNIKNPCSAATEQGQSNHLRTQEKGLDHAQNRV